MRDSLSLVVVNWNRASEVCQLLRDVAACESGPEEIIVVDNGSSDGSAELVASEFPSVSLVSLATNHGLSRGRSEGFARATGDWLVVLDNDMRICDLQFWAKLRTSIRTHSDCQVISFYLLQGAWNDHSEPGRAAPRMTLQEIQDLALNSWAPVAPAIYYEWFLWGGASAIRRSVIETIGSYDEFFAYGGEEWDFSFRCHAAGVRMLRDTSLWMVHLNSPLARSPDVPMLILQNMLLASARYLPLWHVACHFVIQLCQAMVSTIKSGGFLRYLRMVRRLLGAVWPESLAKRRPLDVQAVSRYYFLRTHRTMEFEEVKASRMGLVGYYLKVLLGRVPDRSDSVQYVHVA